MKDDAHSENNVKDVVNSLKDKEMTAEATQQVAVPTTKPPLPPAAPGESVMSRDITQHNISPVGSSPQSSPQVQPRVEQSQNNGRLTSPQASPKTGI